MAGMMLPAGWFFFCCHQSIMLPLLLLLLRLDSLARAAGPPPPHASVAASSAVILAEQHFLCAPVHASWPARFTIELAQQVNHHSERATVPGGSALLPKTVVGHCCNQEAWSSAAAMIKTDDIGTEKRKYIDWYVGHDWN